MPPPPYRQSDSTKNKSPTIGLNLQSQGEDQHRPYLTQQDMKPVLYEIQFPEGENTWLYKHNLQRGHLFSLREFPRRELGLLLQNQGEKGGALSQPSSLQ